MWLQHLTRPNEFLIRSNDIHEIRAYNRAVDLARGEFVAVMQDDDMPPNNGAWVDHALALFDQYPELAVLGCFQGWSLDFSALPEKIRAKHWFGFQTTPPRGDVMDIPFIDRNLGIPFMFVEGLGIGPIFFRRDFFLSVDGFNLGFSKPGESGVFLDYEICMKAWMSGRHVGLFDAPEFRRHVGGQGTMMFGKSARMRNKQVNIMQIRSAYEDKAETIERMVQDLNGKLKPRSTSA
jgi:hypothetical protein